MNLNINILPPLRRQILAQVLKIVFLFGLLGFSLIIAMYVTRANPVPMILEDNLNIKNIMQMESIADTLYMEAKNIKSEVLKKDIANFETLLAGLDERYKQEGEAVTLLQIEVLWRKTNSGKSISHADHLFMKGLFDRMIQQIQSSMNYNLQTGLSISRKTVLIACGIFLIGLVMSIYFSERFSQSIVSPLKQMAESLQNKPQLGQKLKLPEPQCIELKVLTMELRALWHDLSELQAKNQQNIERQRRELEDILAAMEDAIVVLDSNDRITHFNKGFCEILGVEDKSLLFNEPFDDLALVSKAYLNLRFQVRKETLDDVFYGAEVHGEQRIYRIRKRPILDQHQKEMIGSIVLLHDITTKLPHDRFLQLIEQLKKH